MECSDTTKAAVISDCGSYRYLLRRDLGLLSESDTEAVFVMLNPSTADASVDDPTIRRCMGFARSWGHAGLIVINLYAFRSTDPKALRKHPGDVVGPENDEWIRKVLEERSSAICAWGNNADRERVDRFLEIANSVGATLSCLDTTKQGQPKHPLYLSKTASLRPFPS